MATLEAAKAAHLDHKVGSLTPGKEADVVVLNPMMLNTAPLNHAAGAIVMFMDTSNVEAVIIAGRIKKQAGGLVDVDVPAVVTALQRSADGIMARSGSARVLFGTCRAGRAD